MSVSIHSGVVNPLGSVATSSLGASGCVATAVDQVVEPDPDAAITALFANSEKGFWYDPSDLSTLFQDSAGTTPVTAAGQPVGRMLDKSGNGLHMTQATEAARPTLQVSNGLYYLDFGGTHWMSTAAAAYTANNVATVILGVHKTTAVRSLLLEYGPGGTAGAFTVDHSTTASTLNGYGVTLTGGTTSFSRRTAVTYTAPITNVLTVQLDLSIAGVGAITTFLVDGAAPGTLGSPNVASTTGTFTAQSFFIGMRNGASLPFTGRLYAGVVRVAATTESDRNTIQEYVAQKCGVTI